MSGGDRKNADFALVAALAAGATAKDAAATVGVGEATVRRRLQEPEFCKQVGDARVQMVARAVGKLSDATTAAADTLRLLLDAESETVRLGAAKSILELAVKIRESVELEQRIAALEAQQEAAAAQRQGGRA